MSTIIGAVIDSVHLAESKGTPDLDDELLVIDNSSGRTHKKITWRDLITVLSSLISGASTSSVNVSDAVVNVTATDGTVIYFCDCTSNEVQVNFPSAIGNNAIFVVCKVGASANNVVVEGFESETIQGEANATISIKDTSLTFASDGSNWRII